MPVHRRVDQVVGYLRGEGYVVEEVLLLAAGFGAVDAAESLFGAAVLPESVVLEPDEPDSVLLDDEVVDVLLDPPSPDPRESVR